MNALKRHVDSSLSKLQTNSAKHQDALEEKIDEMAKQYKMLQEQNSDMLKMLKSLSGKKATD
jgi:hypothetical protein